MRILSCTSPGELTYADAAMPVMAPGQTILRIKKLGICGTDLHAFEGNQPYFTYPRILGHEIAAEIVETDAAGFNSGDIVTVIPYFQCGNCVACRNGNPNCCTGLKVCGVHIDGGMSEWLSVPSGSLVRGDGLSEDALALAEPLSIGAHAVRRAGVMPKEKVLIVGAGPIGLATAIFAGIAGAEVIMMDVQDHRLGFCEQELGVVHTTNPLKEDVTKKLSAITDGDMPAAVIDATGNLKAINQSFQWIAHGGRYVLVGLQKEQISFSHPEFHKREATLMSSRNALRSDFEWVIDSIRKGLASPEKFITHRMAFGDVKGMFPELLKPENNVIKAMIEF